MGVDLDKWTEKVRRCEYLAEDELKALCEYVSDAAPGSGMPQHLGVALLANAVRKECARSIHLVHMYR